MICKGVFGGQFGHTSQRFKYVARLAQYEQVVILRRQVCPLRIGKLICLRSLLALYELINDERMGLAIAGIARLNPRIAILG